LGNPCTAEGLVLASLSRQCCPWRFCPCLPCQVWCCLTTALGQPWDHPWAMTLVCGWAAICTLALATCCRLPCPCQVTRTMTTTTTMRNHRRQVSPFVRVARVETAPILRWDAQTSAQGQVRRRPCTQQRSRSVVASWSGGRTAPWCCDECNQNGVRACVGPRRDNCAKKPMGAEWQ
jgi:hypothetical protein